MRRTLTIQKVTYGTKGEATFQEQPLSEWSRISASTCAIPVREWKRLGSPERIEITVRALGGQA